MASHGTNGFLKQCFTILTLLTKNEKIFIQLEKHCWPVISYNAEGFLKARGWMELMLSPLSQVTLARLAFLNCTSCASVNGFGLAFES